MKKVFAKYVSAISGNKLLTIGILSVVLFGAGIGVYAKSTDTSKTTLVKPPALTTNQVKNGTTEQAQAPANNLSSSTIQSAAKPNSQSQTNNGDNSPPPNTNSAPTSPAPAQTPSAPVCNEAKKAEYLALRNYQIAEITRVKNASMAANSTAYYVYGSITYAALLEGNAYLQASLTEAIAGYNNEYQQKLSTINCA